MKSENKYNLYVPPRKVESIEECDFYHCMEIPGDGVVKGKWDLRDGVDEYLGGVNFKGKRILEIGTASGFLCFEMEKRGGEVVSFDIGENAEWDVVPFIQYDYKGTIQRFKKFNEGLKNAYWYAHKAYNSKAKVIYGSVYDIPNSIGMVDIGTFCSILLHLRDPFRALQSGLRLVREKVIITDLAPSHNFVYSHRHFLRFISSLVQRYIFFQKNAFVQRKMAYMELLPNFRTLEPKDAWWSLSPEIIVNFLGILGFEQTQITYHTQKFYGKNRRLFTVVGERTSVPYHKLLD